MDMYGPCNTGVLQGWVVAKLGADLDLDPGARADMEGRVALMTRDELLAELAKPEGADE